MKQVAESHVQMNMKHAYSHTLQGQLCTCMHTTYLLSVHALPVHGARDMVKMKEGARMEEETKGMRAGGEERRSDSRLWSGVPPTPLSPTGRCSSLLHLRRCLFTTQVSHLLLSSLSILSPRGDSLSCFSSLFTSSGSEKSSLAIQMGSCVIVCICVCAICVRRNEWVSEVAEWGR